MAMAPVAYTLWQRFLRFDPDDPIWPNRDRFVLSMGHASTLLYSMLHLSKVKTVNPAYETLGELSVKLDDLRAFRQLDSKAPGHPEYRWTSGIETTTGPLGQGIATSVGMAIASRWLAERYDRPGFPLFDFDVYALAGDGCMMEGVSSEAASLAGHLRLSNLCWIYDNNHITIEGNTSLAFTEDVATRFIGYGWNVTRVGDANDLEMLTRAFDTFRAERERPTLVIVDSHIAYGSPTKQDTHGAHGEPLGEEEVRLTKRAYGWPEQETFLVPEGVDEHFEKGIRSRGKQLRDAWFEMFAAYEAQHPELRRRDPAHAEAAAPRRMGRRDPDVRTRREGTRRTRRVAKVQNAIAARRSVADRRIGRPVAFHEDATHIRGRGGRRTRRARRAEPSLRDPRARDGLDPERPLAVEAAAVRLGVPDLLGLRAGGDPAVGLDGDPRHPRLHARLDRRRRGRTDASAGRAAGIAPGDAGAHRAAARATRTRSPRPGA